MSISIADKQVNRLERQQFVENLRLELNGLFGNHKWLIKVVDEKSTPEFFDTSDEEFSRKFLCSSDCYCEGDGDGCEYECDCEFFPGKVGVSVQYNAMIGSLDEVAVAEAVPSIAQKLGVDTAIDKVVMFALIPQKVQEERERTAAATQLQSQLSLLAQSGLSSSELVQQVLMSTLALGEIPKESKAHGVISEVIKIMV